MTPEQAQALRAPFPKSAISKLDRGGGIVLDYVGHAATTARLLEVDPTWTWSPVAFTPDGLPLIDQAGGLWITLTVAGVTRLGYGDTGGKKGPNAVKEAIGDAIRNAAMRFGVALDLWSKDDIASTAPDPQVTAGTVERWMGDMAAAATLDDLTQVGTDIKAHGSLTDDVRRRLLARFDERAAELRAVPDAG